MSYIGVLGPWFPSEAIPVAIRQEIIEVADGEVKEGVHPKEKNVEHQETTLVCLYVCLWLCLKTGYGYNIQ